MDKGDRKNGAPAPTAGSWEPQPGSRPAPGKVTRAGKSPPSRGAAVQRKAVAPTPGATPAPSLWELTMSSAMDAAHRGATALAESSHAPVQARGSIDAEDPAGVHQAAAAGVSGSGSALPHLGRLQEAFGDAHDLSQVRAHVGGEAAAASEHMGASAYATGDRIAFASQPDLHTAAHEAAHVVQQRAGVQLDGGVGRAGDAYEQQADRVADAVVRGESAESLLGPSAGDGAGKGVQRKGVVQRDGEDPTAQAPARTDPDPLTGADSILSRDPTDTSEDALTRFRSEIQAKVQPWGLPFDPAAVRVVGETVDEATTPVVALRWSDTWGARPTTPSTSWVFSSMAPIEARVAVTAVQALAGWGALAAGDRSILQNMLGGETNQLSQTARDHLRGQFAGLGAQPGAQQATTLAGLVSAEGAIPALVTEQVATAPVAYDLQGPTEQPGYAFHGTAADAEVWTARYTDSVQFQIAAPKAPQAGFHYHTVQQAAESAGYLPKPTRSVITTVLLNPVVNPDDAYWAVEYNDPDFHSYMTAGADGVVTIYPDTSSLPDDNYMRGTMIHETGHTWSYRTWGEDTTQGKWVDWQTAMTNDKVAVSGYAHASIAEDVAETITVYVSTQGTPQFDEYCSIVPHRFAMLDQEYR